MALTQRATIMIANLAKRGDSFARNILFKSTYKDQMLISSLAKRGDHQARRHVLGTNAPVMAKALVNRLAKAGECIAQGLNSITVDKNPQVITFAQPANRTFGSAPAALVASSDSGLTVTFAVVSGPATVSGNVLTLTGAGDVVVRASQVGDPNTAAATPVTRTITIDKADQVITFDAPASVEQADSPVTLVATSTSGLAVAFAVQSGPGTVDGDELTITAGTGTIVVRATQAGDDNYNAATPVDESIDVTG